MKKVGLDKLKNYFVPSLNSCRIGVIDAKVKEHLKHKYSFIKGSIAD